ncbi:MAG: carbamoyltransferase HypF [Candidatus Micrarchaeota archaeon]|nr:carbamoyltransferase HypF [Candidatus Micrarchaeota archaeon]
MRHDTSQGGICRLRLAVRGAVQGVGFRPFIFRLASELELKGWVINSPQGVFCEVEGGRRQLDIFLLRMQTEKPPRASIHSLEHSFLDPAGYKDFEIRKSSGSGAKTAFIMPDIATCGDCLREIFDASNRRYRYPFTNCTNCGPRFSIIEALPYDRQNTTMKGFEMCGQCREEYENPLDRRFHAQPNACPKCGPRLELWSGSGKIRSEGDDALRQAAAAVREGKVLALKGIGGFHLIADARSEDAVARLRARKRREQKPFALMFPSLEAAAEHCHISALEERLLLSPESPIVLLKRRKESGGIAGAVAPGNPCFGAMLPYSPLHHLLMAELGFPVVATSGNISGETICTDEREALKRLGSIADLFLVHNRPIARHVDDSLVRMMAGRCLVLRRARGYAPLPITLKREMPAMLAVGAHLKNTIAVSAGSYAFISQHIGDLENEQAFCAFKKAQDDFRRLYAIQPSSIACDLHPDYLPTQFAEKSQLGITKVQHHFAHVVSCMAENELDGQVLGVSWDGTGLGPDRSIWGGEFLLATASSFQRIGHLRTFALPGGEKAVMEPRRSAIGLLHGIFGERLFENGSLAPVRSFTAAECRILKAMLGKRINSPLTSSAGRLFDAVSSITGMRQQAAFEGQAAMELEFALDGIETDAHYAFAIKQKSNGGSQSALLVDWEPMVRQIISEAAHGAPVGDISAKFHNTLAEAIVEIARQAAEEKVVLSGGCFQNKYLTERTIKLLAENGFRPYWHQRVPPNDGGIALGQLVAASHMADG